MLPQLKTNIKKISILAGLLLLVFLILDFNYFYANLEYLFHKPNISGQYAVAPSSVALKTPNMVYVDSLGIEAPVIYIDKVGEKYFQAALINGVVHYPKTALPGQLGNDYIFGHSSDYIWSKGKYKRIFALLPKIQKGAEIRITDQHSTEYTYVVFDSRRVSAKDGSVLSQQGNKRKLLTLQTSYPVGTALARWVVVAELKTP